jgi:calcineurin-like phosphoesterase family protein
MNIWFTSDTHYHHKNIVRGTTSWADDPSKGAASVQRTRDFNTLEEHDDALVNNINKVVGENDILYHLGDWSFGGLEYVWEFRKRLKCRFIHLTLGNHDHHIERNRVLPNAYKHHDTGVFVDGEPLKHGKHYAQDAISTHELFSSVNQFKIDKIGGQSMVLCHYSMRTWDKGHHGTWMLYGHSHGTLPDYSMNTVEMQTVKVGTNQTGVFTREEAVNVRKTFKTMDVGIDTHPEFRPYHIDEIRKIMNKRIPLLVDHHTEDTN